MGSQLSSCKCNEAADDKEEQSVVLTTTDDLTPLGGSLGGRTPDSKSSPISMPAIGEREVDDDNMSMGSSGRSHEERFSLPSDASECGTDAADIESLQDIGRINRTGRRLSQRQVRVVNTMGFVPSAALLLVPDNSGLLSETYTLSDKLLGSGAFAVVKRGTIIASGASRAVKLVDKAKLKDKPAILKQEIEIMKMLDHPNVVMLFEIFEDDATMSLVLELCQGGSLYKYTKKNGRLTEVESSIAISQALRAVYYLHRTQICHRDIKAANCLVVGRGPLDLMNSLKLSDFGLSCVVKPMHMMTTMAGTGSHMAPEVFERKYNESCDLWSVGIMLYWLLSGELPFGDAGPKGKYLQLKFSSKWVDVSQDAVALVTLLLQKDTKLRIGPMKAIAHKWLQTTLPKPPAEILEDRHIEQLRTYRGLNIFKRAVLNVISCMLDEADIGPSRRLFIALDEDGDGMVSMKELVDKVAEAAATTAKKRPAHLKTIEAKKIFSADGKLDSGTLKDFSYTEFVAATFNRRRCLKETVCMSAFNAFDKDRSGTISLSEMAQGRLLGHLPADELLKALTELDVNGDSEIDFQEFMTMVKHS
mmetsp:Transcript_70417/g.126947  ORF Transcript_70417/g.126947 Transcript_70417/m.126947 type:complete len:589 (-) Transcript_70417:79-1845(-)